MRRAIETLVMATLALGLLAPAAQAAVNVNRESQENPAVEIFRSTVYGGLAGLVVGGAIALAADSGGEPVRWGFVIGTFAGLGAGIYFVASRPQPEAMLQLESGTLRAHALPAIEAAPGAVRVHLVGVRF